MKSHEDVVQVLGGLSDRDRAWIIDRLSPQSRSALLNVGSEPTQRSSQATPVSSGIRETSSPSMGQQTSGGTEIVTAATAAQVLAVLTQEPLWVMHALCTRSWPWREELRSIMPPTQQSELQVLERAEIRYAHKLVDLVVEKLAAAIGSTSVATQPSRFESLVNSFGAKLARKRLGMRT